MKPITVKGLEGNPSPGGALRTLLLKNQARHTCSRTFSRRRFLSVAAAAPGLLMASGAKARASMRNCAPNALPHVTVLGGGLPDIHIQLPGIFTPLDTDPSTITDFNGQLGYAIVDGSGTRTDKSTGAESAEAFEVDLRFMKGVFVGTDGRRCNGAFALI